jgi:F-type H+-transporting ATPase subunit c
MEEVFIAKAAAYIGAGLAMGIGSIGPALGQGFVGSRACETLGKYPESANKVRLSMLLAMGFIESSAVYCLIISMLLIFFS